MDLRSIRKSCRWLHRHLSYVFAGVVLVYALSGILMNHRDTINPSYNAERILLDHPLGDRPRTRESVTKGEITALLDEIGEEGRYTKHYFPDERTLKVFLKGGSTLEVDLLSGVGTYDRLRKRPILSEMVRLHYNPGRWWTYFADLFAVGLILITLSGLFLARGRKGLLCIGGVELMLGILVPILFLLL